MDNYVIYHSLCSLGDIVRKYPEGSDAAEEFSGLANQLSEQNYRVAVIGEFKRGKSSLVNAILGTEILPTDILPTTAVINRIVYDNEQKIIIYYKNGKIENSRIEALASYATKLDADKEKFAETIREIEVHYPFVFGQKHIELIDTPGLNDNEKMTSTTIEVLDKIDTAIVVISATMPLSETEQKLICQLIEQKDIYHLIFAVTFIDRVSEEAEEQDRVVDLIKQRITDNTYEYFCKSHDGETELIDKARGILAEPKVFAVSSRLAMQGFIKGDNSLIVKSRFNHFKLQLVALLTANQELDFHSKAKRLAAFAEENVEEWHNQKINALDKEITSIEKRIALLTQSRQRWRDELVEQLTVMDNTIRNIGISLDAARTEKIESAANLKPIFIRHLTSINTENFNVSGMMEMLGRAADECQGTMSDFNANIQGVILGEMDRIENWTLSRSEQCGLDSSDLKISLEKWRANAAFPEFVFTKDIIIRYIDNILGELMPAFNRAQQDALQTYQKSIASYIASWRTILLKANTSERVIIRDILDSGDLGADELKKQKNSQEQKFHADIERIRKIKEDLNNI